MPLNHDNPDGTEHLVVSGRLDAQYADQLAERLDACIRGGAHRIGLDLSAVVYLSSAGIRILVRYAKTLRGLGGGLTLAALSDPVRKVLEMAGIAGIFTVAAAPPASARAADAEQRRGPLSYRVVASNAGEMNARLLGTPERLAGGDYRAADAHGLTVGPDDVAVGIGAFADDFAEGRGRFGEFLAAGGVAVTLPPDAEGRPDFMVARGELRPRALVLHALAAQGEFAAQVRFEATDPSAPADLPALAALCRAVAGAGPMVVVMVAETRGLVGATLRRSPAAGARPADPFAVAALRTWLSFTPDRVHAHRLALVAGVLGGDDVPALADHVRPLAANLCGHLHAAVLSYRAIPAGALDRGAFIRDLFDSQEVLDVLHLLDDDRGLSGAGGNAFSRGVLWLAPLRTGGVA